MLPLEVVVVVVLRVVDEEVVVVVEEVVVVDEDPPPSALRIPVYAGFLTKFESQGQAAPWPEKVLGTQEYLSVQSQMVIPTQRWVWTQAATVLA